MLVLDRAAGHLEHRRFTDLPDYLNPGDVMVFNQSRVIPARLFGIREDNGGRVEFLLLRREADGVWEGDGPTRPPPATRRHRLGGARG